MATLHERKSYRRAVLNALYQATAENRPGTPGSKLREDLGLPEQDLAAACTYLVGEGLVEVDWTTHHTPAMVTLTHEGIRQMEAEEEEREERTEHS